MSKLLKTGYNLFWTCSVKMIQSASYNLKYSITITNPILNMQVQLVVLLINTAFLFAGEEFLILLKRMRTNMFHKKFFWASGACFFIRKNVFKQLNGFD